MSISVEAIIAIFALFVALIPLFCSIWKYIKRYSSTQTGNNPITRYLINFNIRITKLPQSRPYVCILPQITHTRRYWLIKYGGPTMIDTVCITIAFYMRLFSNLTNSQCYTIVNIQMPREFYFERTIVVGNFPR